MATFVEPVAPTTCKRDDGAATPTPTLPTPTLVEIPKPPVAKIRLPIVKKFEVEENGALTLSPIKMLLEPVVK